MTHATESDAAPALGEHHCDGTDRRKVSRGERSHRAASSVVPRALAEGWAALRPGQVPGGDQAPRLPLNPKEVLQCDSLKLAPGKPGLARPA